MRLEEVASKPGTYAGIRLQDETTDAIAQYIKENNIPNAIERNDMHITLLYSKKHLPKYVAKGDMHEVASPNKFTIFRSSPDDGSDSKNCLVLLLNSEYLQNRYAKLTKQHGATSDYDTYSPHITFSYDVGDMDISKLPKFKPDIVMVKEYKEKLQP